jgi:transposase-like protein
MASKNSVEAKLAQLREGQWSETDARLVLAELERSGDTVSAFARAHGLSAKRIYSWRTRLADKTRNEVAVDRMSFAPVVVTGLGRTPALILRRGELEIEVVEPQEVEPAWLAQLLVAAERGQ